MATLHAIDVEQTWRDVGRAQKGGTRDVSFTLRAAKLGLGATRPVDTVLAVP
jgi:hypothetical protein